MRWSTYPHRSTYQWTGLPRVPVSTSEPATRADNDWPRRQSQSPDSEPAWMATHSIQQRTFFYSHLLRFSSIHNIDGNSKMICTADRMKHILYASRKRMEHILYAWNHEDMSWNSFIVEYLKLDKKGLLEWQG